MTGRTAETVFSGEGRDGGCRLTRAENENHPCNGKKPDCPLRLLTEVRLRPHTHGCTPQNNQTIFKNAQSLLQRATQQRPHTLSLHSMKAIF
jgi:hypothetical protein